VEKRDRGDEERRVYGDIQEFINLAKLEVRRESLFTIRVV